MKFIIFSLFIKMGKTVSYKKNKARGTSKKAKVANKGRTMKKSGGMRKSTSMRKRRGAKKSGGAKKRPGMRKQRGGDAVLIKIEEINEIFQREEGSGNISSKLRKCLTDKNIVEDLVTQNLEKWKHLNLGEWTTKVIMAEDECKQIYVEELRQKTIDVLRKDMSDEKISFSKYQFIIVNNKVGGIIAKNMDKWGHLTPSELATQIITKPLNLI
jgi:hypothetical protein